MNVLTHKSEASVFDAWLASACMPPETVRCLLETFGGAEACFSAFRSCDEAFRSMIPLRFLRLLENNGTAEYLKRTEDLMKRHSIGILRYTDQLFPTQLMQIDEAPAILFIQGNPVCLKNRMLSMVGSRAASYTGQKAAGKVASDLSRQGVTIVSGLACGIDAASHQGCIEGGTPTIAVTACGLDTVYPKSNILLRNRILDRGGLLISEYAPGEKPAGWHFPFRNRIITGLGRALILIEARIRSGSMTSVRHALDQGKDVFVYPGDPSSDQFEGNHQLLREGATYFTSAEDILDDLHWLDNPPLVRQNSDCSADTASLPPEQSAIIRALKPGTLCFEHLLDKTGLSPSTLMSALTVLQISGRVESMPGKKYQLKQ